MRDQKATVLVSVATSRGPPIFTISCPEMDSFALLVTFQPKAVLAVFTIILIRTYPVFQRLGRLGTPDDNFIECYERWRKFFNFYVRNLDTGHFGESLSILDKRPLTRCQRRMLRRCLRARYNGNVASNKAFRLVWRYRPVLGRAVMIRLERSCNIVLPIMWDPEWG